MTFFAEYVTGIKPIDAGFDTYEVRPNFAGLNAASQHVETVKGALNVTMKRTDAAGPTAGYELTLHSPSGSQANVSLPLDGIRSFKSGASQRASCVQQRHTDQYPRVYLYRGEQRAA